MRTVILTEDFLCGGRMIKAPEVIKTDDICAAKLLSEGKAQRATSENYQKIFGPTKLPLTLPIKEKPEIFSRPKKKKKVKKAKKIVKKFKKKKNAKSKSRQRI